MQQVIRVNAGEACGRVVDRSMRGWRAGHVLLEPRLESRVSWPNRVSGRLLAHVIIAMHSSADERTVSLRRDPGLWQRPEGGVCDTRGQRRSPCSASAGSAPHQPTTETTNKV